MATCLYKPKPCDVCGKVISVGEECSYVPETKGVRHYGCEPEPEPPGPADFARAADLGFVPASDIGSVSWVAVCADWVLRQMLPSVICPSAGRTGPVTRGRNANLFDEE